MKRRPPRVVTSEAQQLHVLELDNHGRLESFE